MARRRFLPARFRWPLALLFASIGLTGLAAFDAQRAVRSNRALADEALREYGSFAAWSYQQHLHEALASLITEPLGPVNHGDDVHRSPRIPDASELVHYLSWSDRCGCHTARRGPNPIAFYGFRLGTDTLAVAANLFAEPARGWLVDEPGTDPHYRGMMLHYLPDSLVRRTSAAERAWINDTLTRTIRRGAPTERGYAMLVGDWAGERRVLAWTLMPTLWGDTIVYATEYAPRDVEALLGRVLDARDLLPQPFTRGRGNRDVLGLEVLDARGRPLFSNAAAGPWTLDARYALPPSSGGLVVHARIQPAIADALVIGGLPRSRLPFLLGLLALATGLSVVAVMQLRREGELARLRADFVSSVSHELRTPLAQIRLYLETLRLGRWGSEAQREHALVVVDRETRRLAHLVENVLQFSRSGRGDRGPRQRVDVAAEIASIAEEFAPLAAARRARIAVALDDPPPVAMRAGALRQVLLNLLDNAVKYGPADQTVRVSARGAVAAGGPALVVTVDDEGRGVAPDEREAVWRPFQRGAAATELGAGGSGIGLAVVREIVSGHGGRTAVASAPGGGARFVVELPALAAAAHASAPSAATPAVGAATGD